MPHDPANNGCPKNADSRNETCSCAEADERGGSTKGRLINLTPAGLLTQEGITRSNKAIERFADAKAGLANFTATLCKTLANGSSNYRRQAEVLNKILDAHGCRTDCDELADLLKENAYAQEELLRAVADAPPMKED